MCMLCNMRQCLTINGEVGWKPLSQCFLVKDLLFMAGAITQFQEAHQAFFKHLIGRFCSKSSK